MTLAAYFLAPLRQSRLATALCVLAIALGVGLGVAVDTINRSALAEFSRGMRVVSGQADLEVRGGREGFDEAVYASVARVPGVRVASPMLELDAKLPGREGALRLIGIDAFQASRISPVLVPGWDTAERLSILDPDSVFLSPAAARRLDARSGDSLAFQSGVETRRLRVAGLIAGAPEGQQLAVMDIAGAQWRFDRLGTITRIGVKLAEGASSDRVREAIGRILPPGLVVETPTLGESRQDSLSRAYRVNLNMLALIGLFTGALLVLAAQAMATARRRGELAFLRAAGATRGQVVRWLLAQGVAIGMAGALLGILLGYLAAALALRYFGADLGAGYFEDRRAALALDPLATLLFLALGVLAAAFGAWGPAREAAASEPAPALRASDDYRALGRAPRLRVGAALVLAGASVAFLPPVAGLPAFGYLAVASILLGAIALMPGVALRLFERLPEGREATWMLAVAQLRGVPGQSYLAASGIVASIGLATAMAIMVASFRDSLDVWLDQVLPADLYVRASGAAQTGFLDERAVASLSALPGVARSTVSRHTSVLLDPAQPAVALIARDDPAASLALVSRADEAESDLPEAWISEAVADLYGWRLGQAVDLPLAGRRNPFRVAGVWRDYARQHGAIVIDLAAYRERTGDARASVAELWLEKRAAARDVIAAVRERLAGEDRIEIADPGEIRAVSLGIFDRTFAVTYGMEAAAVTIGLFGVATSFASLAALRRREFGMLRHLGMTRGQVGRMLALEGALVAALGVAGGMVAGASISLILVHVVNRQSFHWSMDMSVPGAPLAALGVATVCVAALAAVVAGRRAMQADVVRAVREDW